MTTCPKCGRERIKRDVRRVRPNGKFVDAGWYVCLNCWHKWDGVTKDGSPFTIPYIVPRWKAGQCRE